MTRADFAAPTPFDDAFRRYTEIDKLQKASTVQAHERHCVTNSVTLELPCNCIFGADEVITHVPGFPRNAP